jgi:hypothetical protein
MSRTRKQKYRKSRTFDSSCRNHGACPYCEQNRRFFDTKSRIAVQADHKIGLEEWEAKFGKDLMDVLKN